MYKKVPVSILLHFFARVLVPDPDQRDPNLQNTSGGGSSCLGDLTGGLMTTGTAVIYFSFMDTESGSESGSSNHKINKI